MVQNTSYMQHNVISNMPFQNPTIFTTIRNNATEMDFDDILEAPDQEAITTQPNYNDANNVNMDVHDDNGLTTRESLGDLDFDMDNEEYFDGPPKEFDDDFVPPYSG